MNATTLSPTELHRTFVAIERNGGSFCEKLARAWFHGDGGNKRAPRGTPLSTCWTEFGPGSALLLPTAPL
jgi:hypothetical protein